MIPSKMNDIEQFLDNETDNTTKYVIDKKLKWRIRDMLDQMNINERITCCGLKDIIMSGKPKLERLVEIPKDNGNMKTDNCGRSIEQEYSEKRKKGLKK